MMSTHMSFYGLVVPKLGLQPDIGKVDAIKCIERLQDVKSDQSSLGMIHYLTHFITHVSDFTKPLRDL